MYERNTSSATWPNTWPNMTNKGTFQRNAACITYSALSARAAHVSTWYFTWVTQPQMSFHHLADTTTLQSLNLSFYDVSAVFLLLKCKLSISQYTRIPFLTVCNQS